jgi:hypothetical protein
MYSIKRREQVGIEYEQQIWISLHLSPITTTTTTIIILTSERERALFSTILLHHVTFYYFATFNQILFAQPNLSCKKKSIVKLVVRKL